VPVERRDEVFRALVPLRRSFGDERRAVLFLVGLRFAVVLRAVLFFAVVFRVGLRFAVVSRAVLFFAVVFRVGRRFAVLFFAVVLRVGLRFAVVLRAGLFLADDLRAVLFFAVVRLAWLFLAVVLRAVVLRPLVLLGLFLAGLRLADALCVRFVVVLRLLAGVRRVDFVGMIMLRQRGRPHRYRCGSTRFHWAAPERVSAVSAPPAHAEQPANVLPIDLKAVWFEFLSEFCGLILALVAQA